jgi:hypothetical protein
MRSADTALVGAGAPERITGARCNCIATPCRGSPSATWSQPSRAGASVQGAKTRPHCPDRECKSARYRQLKGRKQSREFKAAQMRQIGVKAMDCSAELCHGNPIWEPTMTQSLTLDDQRAIARRLFEALCAKYPERYIALIQPRDTAEDGLPTPDLTAVESSPASLS